MMRKKPMLAYPVSDKPIDYSKPTFIQPKLDGVRCVIQYDKENGVKAYSRTGKEWKNIDHILEQLMPFFVKRDFANADVILDGELYNHDLKNDFEKIISLVRKTKPTEEDRLESAEMTKFYCYDVIFENGDVPYSQRRNFIGENLYYGYKTVRTLEHQLVHNTEEVEVWHEEFLEQGYEGSILRKNAPYECKRSWTLMKV